MVTAIRNRISKGISRGARGCSTQRRAKRRNHSEQRNGECHRNSQAAAYTRARMHTIILRYAETVAGSTVSIRGVQNCGFQSPHCPRQTQEHEQRIAQPLVAARIFWRTGRGFHGRIVATEMQFPRSENFVQPDIYAVSAVLIS
jgi:hypothetical protein